MKVDFLESISDVSAIDWDILSDPNDPFTTHAFLNALEKSHSVGSKAGWLPIHVVLYQGETLCGALPLYLKNHSYGEYIFDWSWAEAAERAGIPYFPKLVSAVPFTPATGPRFLLAHCSKEHQKKLWEGALYIAQAMEAHSIHLLFLPEAQANSLQETEFMSRWTHQYHWTNPNVSSFNEWLSLFRSKDRKKIKSERKRAQQSVDKIYHLSGKELTSTHIEALWDFYQKTTSRKWGNPYLTKSFFTRLNQSLSDITIAFFAEKENQLIAGSLCFQRGQHLYGRYWGCKTYNDSLHFELCYHQPIELAIQRGWTRFEAGAQGEHKIKRGLLPTKIYSAHWIKHAGLQQGIERFLSQERTNMALHIERLAKHGPFRRNT